MKLVRRQLFAQCVCLPIVIPNKRIYINSTQTAVATQHIQIANFPNVFFFIFNHFFCLKVFRTIVKLKRR
jgi:hypothetical protein